jgi:hypothetical protein
MNFDPSSDAQSSAEFDTSPEMVVDYFTSHDVTQVESEKCIHDESEGANNMSPGITLNLLDLNNKFALF